MSRCCGDQDLCQTWVTWICRRRNLSCCCVSFVACSTQQDSVCRHLLAPGMPLPRRRSSHWQGYGRTQETTVPWGWLPVAGALPLGEQSLHRDTETHLSILCTPCSGSCVGPWMKTQLKSEKAKVTSVLWVCDTTGTQWTCPKKVKLGGMIQS